VVYIIASHPLATMGSLILKLLASILSSLPPSALLPSPLYFSFVGL